ncbi:MAG TPA: hypothetical protein VFF16_07815 [Telluria sp.]|nr:hypothetical protein [Telluria sp.]
MRGLTWVLAATLAGCGGGGGGTRPAAPPPVVTAVTLQGTVSGVGAGSLQISDGTETVEVKQDGSFSFPTPLEKGSDFVLSLAPSNFLSCFGAWMRGKVGTDVPELQCYAADNLGPAFPKQMISFTTSGWIGYTIDADSNAIWGLNINAEYFAPIYGQRMMPGYGPNRFHFSVRSAFAKSRGGYVVFSDTCNGVVRAFDDRNGNPVVAGVPEDQCARHAEIVPRDGPAGQARLLRPGALAVARDKSLWVAEDRPDVLRRVAADGSVSTVVLVSDMPDRSLPGMIDSLAWLDDAGVLLLTSADSIWQVRDGHAARLASAPAVTAPAHIAVGEDGLAYFYDSGRINTIALDGSIRAVVDSVRPLFGFADANSYMQLNTIVYPAFGFLPDVVRTPAATQMAVGAGASLVYADASTRALVRVTTPGQLKAPPLFVAGKGTPQSAVAGKDGLIWFVDMLDAGHALIRAATADGVVRDMFAVDGNAADAQLDVAADGRVGLTLPEQGEVRLYAADGGLQLRVSAADLGTDHIYPEAAAFDSQGRFYFFERATLQVHRIGADGKAQPFAGTRDRDGYVDGPPGTARFDASGPASLAIDENDRLFLSGQGRLRMIGPDGVTSTPEFANQHNNWLLFRANGLAVCNGYVYGLLPGVGMLRAPLP